MTALWVAVAVLLAFLSGCTTVNSKITLAAACQSHAATVAQKTPQKMLMTRAQIKRVDDSIALLRPVCAEGSTFDPALGIALVLKARDMIR